MELKAKMRKGKKSMKEKKRKEKERGTINEKPAENSRVAQD